MMNATQSTFHSRASQQDARLGHRNSYNQTQNQAIFRAHQSPTLGTHS